MLDRKRHNMHGGRKKNGCLLFVRNYTSEDCEVTILKFWKKKAHLEFYAWLI